MGYRGVKRERGFPPSMDFSNNIKRTYQKDLDETLGPLPSCLKMYRAHVLLKRRKNVDHLLNTRREFWPLVAGGAVAFIVVSYAFRALNRLEEADAASYRSSRGSSRGSDRRTIAIVGVDIGSTKSRVAIQRSDDAQPFIVENREGKRSTSAMVHFTSKSYDLEKLMAGTDEQDKDAAIVVGSTAGNFRFRKPDQTFSGTDLLFGKKLEVHERAAMYSLLAVDMKDVAEESYAKREEEEDSSNSDTPQQNAFYFAVPNSLRTIDASAMVLACASAGLSVVGLVPDAVAAVAGAFELNLLSSTTIKHVMVVDIGGSIVQIAAVRLLPTPLMHDRSSSQLPLPVVLSEVTLTQNGGNYYDEQIVNFLNDEFEQRHQGIRIIDDPMAKQRLYDAAEGIKIELSSAVHGTINLPFLTANQTGPKHLECEFNRNQFERLIDKYVVEIEQTMVSKDLFSSISFDALVITGGGGRIPNLLSRLEKIAKVKLNIPLICIDSQPEDMNSIGIVAYAKLLRNLSAL